MLVDAGVVRGLKTAGCSDMLEGEMGNRFGVQSLHTSSSVAVFSILRRNLITSQIANL